MAQIDSQGSSDGAEMQAQTETNGYEAPDVGVSPVDSQCGAQATMQATFDKVVSKEIGTPFRYTHVAVLIIRWADYLDRHLNCAGEVQELNHLLVDKFKFKSAVLILDDKRNPQLQLNRGLANFVYDNDGPCRTNLLIVYYTGHGMHAEEEGLDITGVREPGFPAIAPHHEPRANWNEAEASLHHADADVLTILDTCSAGSVIKGANDDLKVFEVFAATMRKSVTAAPGKRSFTRALIDSLNAKLDEHNGGAFTTQELNEAVMRKRENQSSHVFGRYVRINGRFIQLTPLDVVPSAIQDSQKVPTVLADCSHLTLRFVMGMPKVLSEEQTENLATRLSRAAVESNVNVRTIEWVNYRGRNGFAEWAALYQTVKKVQRRWKALVSGEFEQKAKRSREESDQEDDSTIQPPSKALKSALSVSQEICEILTPPRSTRGHTESPS